MGLNLAFTGTIKDEIMDTSDIAFYLVKYLSHNHLNELSEKYKLSLDETKELLENSEDENQAIMELIETIGRKRGALVSRAEK